MSQKSSKRRDDSLSAEPLRFLTEKVPNYPPTHPPFSLLSYVYLFEPTSHISNCSLTSLFRLVTGLMPKPNIPLEDDMNNIHKLQLMGPSNSIQ